jgi:hypothetical protein
MEGEMGQVVRKFRAGDTDKVRVALGAVQEMMDWLNNAVI